MNTITVLNSEIVTTSAAEEARIRRDDLLGLAKACPLVVNAETQAAATDLLRDLRSFAKTIETGRETAKAPVIRIGREIDALAQELSAQVEAEAKRISTVLGAYDTEQKRIAEAKRQEAYREEQRIRREAEEKERAEQQRLAAVERAKQEELAKELRRLQAEADAKAARARTEAGRERAAAEAEKQKEAAAQRAREEAAQREQEALEAGKRRDEEEARRVAETRQAGLAMLTAKPKGTSTSEKIMYEVTDIVALYEAAPYLVTMEPNVAALKSALKGLQAGKHLPGVRHWYEASTITRG